MIPPTDLINVSWKPCSQCKGKKTILDVDMKKFGIGYPYLPCPNCQGHGLEPVEVENEMVEKLLKHGVINEYKHQVGVPFEIPIHQAFHSAVLVKFVKFLPIRAEGSKMWVVKVG